MSVKLLLDFDGVVLNNHKLGRYQRDRSAMFVSKHRSMLYAESKVFNASEYPKHGHTVIMMNKTKKEIEKPVTLEQYNNFVYSQNQLRLLNRFVDEETYKAGNKFNEIFTECDRMRIDWYIFTNAHINWILHFSKLMDLPVTSQKVIWPYTIENLKPKRMVYDSIERRFPNSDFVFVDDSDVNFCIPMQRENWRPVKYKGDIKDITHALYDF